MQGRAFLDIATELTPGATEAHWRAAAGRIYYGLFLEARDALARWGFTCSTRDSVHHFVRAHLIQAGAANLKKCGYLLENLSRLRNAADYQMTGIVRFQSDLEVVRADKDARLALSWLDQVDGDPARRAAAIAAIRAVFP